MAIVEDGPSLWQLILLVILLGIPVLYLNNRTFKYYVKFTVYFTVVLIIGTSVIFYGIPRPRDPENHFFCAFWVKKVLCPLMGVEVIVRGMEHLNRDEPVIVVLNHQSSLDIMSLFAMWPKNCVILAKKELIYSAGTFGLGAWMCGTIYISRGNSNSARKTMGGTADQVKAKKLKVAVFPEGTRNHGGSLLPFKKGAFHLAVEAQVPVVPVVISSYQHFYNKQERRFDEGKVIVEVLPPIPTQGLESDDVSTLTDRTREIMLESFDKISEEVTTLR